MKVSITPDIPSKQQYKVKFILKLYCNVGD